MGRVGRWAALLVAARVYELLLSPGDALAGRGYWLYAPGAVAALALIDWPEMLGGTLALTGALRPLNALLLVGLALGGFLFQTAL
jgi:hypothetical protein